MRANPTRSLGRNRALRFAAKPARKAITMTTKPGSSDQEFLDLLQRARDGDQDALGRLINSYRHYLLRIAYDEGDTDLQAKDGDSDYVQDACLRAICAFQHFKGASAEQLRGWLRTILINQLHEARRQATTKKRDIHAEVPLRRFDDDSRNDRLPVTRCSAAEQVLRQEELAILEMALRGLPERDRVIFEMRQKDGHAFAEIARQLNLSEVAVQKRWVRTLSTLKEKVTRLDGRSVR